MTIHSARPGVAEMAPLAGQPYLVVSTDSHAGPSPEEHLRPYCPPKYLTEFDQYCRWARATADRSLEMLDSVLAANSNEPTLRELGAQAMKDCIGRDAHHDAHARLRDMGEAGVAVDVVFAGGQNFEQLPFMGKGWDAGPTSMSGELRSIAAEIWNRWLADYVSADPNRLLGVLQTSVWDVDDAVREVEWGAGRGLRVVNLPAPRADFPSYTDPIYEPLWSVCEATGSVLATHSGGGEPPLGMDGPKGRLLMINENHWLGNRGLAQLIFGGVFHRHPKLKYVLTEQRVDFAPQLIRHLDSVYHSATCGAATGGGVLPSSPFILEAADIDADRASEDALPLPPSEYWAANCFLSGSFLAPFEVALRHEVGLTNLMWGSDYPHMEGTWPYTTQALQHTFADVPEDEARLILGETAVAVYGIDRQQLANVAQRIGPRPADIAAGLNPLDEPLGRGGAFREYGSYA